MTILNVMINIWAVLASAVASMIIGSIWYGPLFGKTFITAMGWGNKTPEESKAMMKGMQMTYVWQFIASVVMFVVLAWFIGDLNKLTVMGGIKTALLVWIGFVAPMKLGDSLWGGKMTLFWLGAGNSLVTLLAAGAIIGAIK